MNRSALLRVRPLLLAGLLILFAVVAVVLLRPLPDAPEAPASVAVEATDATAALAATQPTGRAALQANPLATAPSAPATRVHDPRAEQLAAALKDALANRDQWSPALQPARDRAPRDPALIPANGELLPEQRRALKELEWRFGKQPLHPYVDPAQRTIRYLEAPVLHRPATVIPPDQSLAEATARDFMHTNAVLFRMENPDTELRTLQETTSFAGHTAVRFQQTYQGLEVFPAAMTVETNKFGNVALFTGSYVPTPKGLDTNPKLSLDDAIAAARVALADDGSAPVAEQKLLIYAYRQAPTLAYHVELQTGPHERWQVIVDAQTGAIINTLDELMMAATPSQGQDNRGATRQFSTWNSGQGFLMVDTTLPMFNPGSQPPSLQNTQGAVFILHANQAQDVSGDIFFHGSNNANGGFDPDGVAAMHATRESFRFFNDVLGRSSLDGQGINMISIVDVAFNNAYWDPNARITVYGTPDGQTSYAQSIDVVGHEFTHGVVTFSANLIYEYQSGAMNEAYADIGGSSIEFMAFPQTANWLMGNPSDIGQPFRNMQDPSSLDIGGGFGAYPDRMSEYINTDQNNGGVHLNCTIPGHAFYLAAVGLPNAIGMAKAQQIFFDALFTKLQPSSQFVDMRLACVASARQIYGNGSVEAQVVAEAFDRVEIFGPGGNDPDPGPGNDNQAPPLPSSDGGDNTLFSYFDFDQGLNTYLYAATIEGQFFYIQNSDGFLVTSAPNARPSVAGNIQLEGTPIQFATLVTGDNDLYLLDLNTGEGTALGLSPDVQVASAAVAPNGILYSFVFLDPQTGMPEPRISLIDALTSEAVTYDLKAAHAGLNGETSGAATITQAGVMEFAPSGSVLFYDAENQFRVFGQGEIRAWSIYAFDYTRPQPSFLSIIDPVQGLQIGNMSLGTTFVDLMAFEVAEFLPDGANSQGYIANLTAGQLNAVTPVFDAANGFLQPAFNGDDSGLMHTYPFVPNDQNSGFFYLLPLAESRIETAGNPQFWPVFPDAVVGAAIAGVIYRSGAYQGLPTLAVEALVAQMQEGQPEQEVFRITREGDVSTELPFSFTLTGGSFEPTPLEAAFPVDVAALTLTLAPANDNVNTGNRQIAFTIVPQNYFQIDPQRGTAAVAVIDDDVGGAGITVGVEPLRNALNEGVGTVDTFRVFRTGDVSQPLTINFRTGVVGGEPNTGTYQFDANVDAVIFTLTYDDDNVNSGSRQWEFIVEPGQGYQVAAQSRAVVDLVDNDGGGPGPGVNPVWQATSLGGPWYRSAWFGDFALTEVNGLVFHNRHGFIGVVIQGNEVYVYDFLMGWLFTRADVFPAMYRFANGTWYWYQDNGADPREFINLNTSLVEFFPKNGG